MLKKRRPGDQHSSHPLPGKQYGYVTRQQLLAIGLSAGAVRHLIATGRLIPVHAGVYAVGHVNMTPVAKACAAVLACGPGAVLSHGSAATLWGFDKYWDRPYEITAPTARRRPGIKVHRSRTLTRRDMTRQLGVPVTSPARTALDMTPRLSPGRLTRLVNDGRHARHLNLDDLADVIQRNPTHPGAKRLRPFAESRSGPTRSELEDRFVAFCGRYGLPTPATSVELLGYEVDALFAVEKVIVELDSWEFHGLRPNFEGDRNRDADMLAAGYQTVRITDERMTQDPEGEARRLHAILNARRKAA